MRGKLSEECPKLCKEWHPTKNGSLRPEDVTAGSEKKVWWQCTVCDCEWDSRIGNRTILGRGCPKCGRAKGHDSTRLKIENVRRVFQEQGCELLEDNYTGCRQLLKYRCSCGEIAYVGFIDFKQGRRCRKCFSERLSNHFRLSYEYVKRFFADQGCKLLSTEYKNARTKLKYRCNCGRESEIVFDSFRKGNRCKKCGNRITALKQTGCIRGAPTNKLSYEYVKSYF